MNLDINAPTIRKHRLSLVINLHFVPYQLHIISFLNLTPLSTSDSLLFIFGQQISRHRVLRRLSFVAALMSQRQVKKP